MPPPDLREEERDKGRKQLQAALLRVTGDPAKAANYALKTEEHIFNQTSEAAVWRRQVTAKVKALLAKVQKQPAQQAAAQPQPGTTAVQQPQQQQQEQQQQQQQQQQRRPAQVAAPQVATGWPQAQPTAVAPSQGVQATGQPAKPMQAAPAAVAQSAAAQHAAIVNFNKLHAYGQQHLLEDLRGLVERLAQAAAASSQPEKYRPKLQRAGKMLALLQADPAKAAGRLDERAVSQFRSTLDEVAKDVKQYRRYKEQLRQKAAGQPAGTAEAPAEAALASAGPASTPSGPAAPATETASASGTSTSANQLLRAAAVQAATSRPPGTAQRPPGDGAAQLRHLLAGSSADQLASAAGAFGQACGAWERMVSRPEEAMLAVPLPEGAAPAPPTAAAAPRRVISHCSNTAHVPGEAPPPTISAPAGDAMEVDEESSGPAAWLLGRVQQECDRVAAQLGGRAALAVLPAEDAATSGSVLVACTATGGQPPGGAAAWRTLLLRLPAGYPQQPPAVLLGAPGGQRDTVAEALLASSCREAFAEACQALQPPPSIDHLAAAWADAVEASLRAPLPAAS